MSATEAHWTVRIILQTNLPVDEMSAILADIFKCIFLNENDIIPIQISLTFVSIIIRVFQWWTRTGLCCTIQQKLYVLSYATELGPLVPHYAALSDDVPDNMLY